ncbi:MAG: SIMPL domain-containing protein [Woeseiaceae bacterium]|nr:SIMPL domain-containing protein [Woeseiaceae bacterium]
MIRVIILCSLLVASACTVADEGRANPETERTVSVSGNATASATPDSALVDMGIVVRSKQLGEAQSRVAEQTNALLEATDKLGIDRSKIDTTGANVRPEYRWNRNTEQQEFVGYIAERRISVTVEELEILGQLIEGAVSAGVNQVSSPVLQSAGREAAYREALKRAALNARSNAEILASTLGASLGDAIKVNASSAVPFQPRAGGNLFSVAESAAAPASYNPGELTFNATVNVTFALVD